MAFRLQILGSNSALPAHGRSPSAQLLYWQDEIFLIDCGEGTQMRLSEYGVKRSRIGHVFISHLHGDHVYGLPGLLGSYNHFGRTDKLTIIGPEGIKGLLDAVHHYAQAQLLYPLEVREFSAHKCQEVLVRDGLKVTAFPLRHRVPTLGYRFDHEQPLYNIDPDAIANYGLEIPEIRAAKEGVPPIRDGKPVPLEGLVLPKSPPVSYAYCSDTVYDPDVASYVHGVDLLYHEATYREDLSEKAAETMHSTAQEAARIAKEANVGKLIIGHYSSRYRNLDGHLQEARAIFPNTDLAEEGGEWSAP